MPELPEVETVIKYLQTKILNKKILKIIVNKEKILKNINAKDFIKKITNTKFISADRRGKYLIFKLLNDITMVSHLRMEGKFIVDDINSEFIDNKHSHILFYLEDDIVLIYNDTRQFGTFNIYENDDHLLSKEIIKLGPEPFDEIFNDKYLYNLTKGSNKKIKTFILDQTKVVGIGNIYADEILFASSISPTRIAKTLSIEEIGKIVKNTKSILLESIKNNGTTIHSFKFSK